MGSVCYIGFIFIFIIYVILEESKVLGYRSELKISWDVERRCMEEGGFFVVREVFGCKG